MNQQASSGYELKASIPMNQFYFPEPGTTRVPSFVSPYDASHSEKTCKKHQLDASNDVLNNVEVGILNET
jgi:hypothetical protein